MPSNFCHRLLVSLIVSSVSTTSCSGFEVPVKGSTGSSHGRPSAETKNLINVDLSGIGHSRSNGPEKVATNDHHHHPSPKLMTLDLSVLRERDPIVMPVSTSEWSDSNYYNGHGGSREVAGFGDYEDFMDEEEDEGELAELLPPGAGDDFMDTNHWPPAPPLPGGLDRVHEMTNGLSPLQSWFRPLHGIYQRSRLLPLSTGNDALSDFLEGLRTRPDYQAKGGTKAPDGRATGFGRFTKKKRNLWPSAVFGRAAPRPDGQLAESATSGASAGQRWPQWALRHLVVNPRWANQMFKRERPRAVWSTTKAKSSRAQFEARPDSRADATAANGPHRAS